MSFAKLSADEIRKHKGISFPGVTTVFICHDGQGNVFMAKRSARARDEHGRWDFGGGGLKHGYSLEDNVRREVKEEYDAEAKDIEFIGYFDAFRETPEGVPTHWLAMCFAVRVDPAEVKINEPDLFDDGGWFTLDSLPSPPHSQIGIFMNLHSARLKEIMAI